jgi:hypothetical protein
MLLSIRSLIIFCIVFCALGVSAETLKYELQNIDSHNAEINYPGLDFNGAQSATLTVEKNSATQEAELVSLDLVFPNAASLKARNFKKNGPNRYRTIVSEAWIFREVLVEIDVPDFSNDAPVAIEVRVVETTSYLNPEAESAGSYLLLAHGMLKDVTPEKVVDTGFAIVNGKRVNLSLKDRVSFNNASPQFGIAIDALWMGYGQKTLYIHPPVSFEHFDFVEPIALIIETTNTSGSTAHMVSVKFQLMGDEIVTPPYPLADLLNEAYGL